MKKIATLLFSLGWLFLHAQVPDYLKSPPERNRISAEEVEQVKVDHLSSSRNLSLYIDYPSTDQAEQQLSLGALSVQNYLWTFNSNYTAADTSDVFPINYAAVRLLDLAGYTDLADPVNTYTGILPYTNDLLVTIDTIFVLLSHENNSGQSNSIILELKNLDANNNIQPTNTTVWENTTTTNSSLSPGGNYLGTDALTVFSVPCGFQLGGSQRVGLNFRYEASKLDTLALLASYVINPNGPQTPPNDKALKTAFPHNYFRWMGILNNGIYKTSDIFYTPQPGQDTGYFKIQNWQMWFSVTFEDAITATQEKMILPLGLDQNYPNPFEFSSSFSFTIQESQDLTLQITDVNGRIIANKELGHHLTGSYNAPLPTENLSAGAYFYQLIGENDKSAVRRFIVSK
jgi:hypothetical protein